MQRKDLSYSDLEESLNLGAFNELGGLQNADLIQKSLIDMYVPFLPLEKSHVKLCIREYTLRIFKQLGFGGIEIRWDGMIEWIAMQLNGF